MSGRLSGWRSLARRPVSDWCLLVEALGTAAAAKWQIWTVPFARIAANFGTMGAETLHVVDGEKREVARQVSWAVQAVGRYLPQRVVCLPQAMAALRMLARRGVPTTLYLGVKPDETNAAGMEAHAWLRAGNFTVTGKASRQGHVVVGMFACMARERDGVVGLARWWVAGLTLAVLVIATLVPQPPLQDLRQQAWAAEWRHWLHWVGTNDFWVNVAGFAVANVALHLAWFGWRRAPWRYRLRSAGMVLALTTVLECAQLALPGRHFDPMDLVAAGVAIPLSTLPWMVRQGHRRDGSP